MKILFHGLVGPILDFANAVNDYLDRLRSVPALIVADIDSLPPAQDGRTVIVRDIDGVGGKGKATALDGAWYDENWSAL